MRFGSVCSGIEAASVAWHPLGWSAAWLAEIEKFPAGVLAHHYPSVPNLGDMTKIARRVLTGEVEAPDVLVGGTPCQAFSVAGLREGLADERGQLTIKFVELADAIDFIRARRGASPSTIVWENVPGVLSSKDNAFGCFLAALAGEDDEIKPPGEKWANAGCVYGPTRTVAWRILDAQYFGVAQRRRRVFVVASARNDFDPTKVLFEFESVRRDSPPSREAGEEVAGNVTHSIGSGSDPELMATLCAMDDKKWGCNQWVNEGKAILHVIHGTQDPDVKVDLAHTLGRNQGQENAVAYSLAGNTIGRQPENGGNGNGFSEEISYTLARTDQHGVAHKMAVRRLTPTECERLQGFPDGYTRLNDNTPDGNRYKALGNSMAVPVMAWIGKRINDVIS